MKGCFFFANLLQGNEHELGCKTKLWCKQCNCCLIVCGNQWSVSHFTWLPQAISPSCSLRSINNIFKMREIRICTPEWHPKRAVLHQQRPQPHGKPCGKSLTEERRAEWGAFGRGRPSFSNLFIKATICAKLPLIRSKLNWFLLTVSKTH